MAEPTALEEDEPNKSYFATSIQAKPQRTLDMLNQSSTTPMEFSTCSPNHLRSTALAPSGIFEPGTCIEDITYSKLENLNLIVLTILAAELDEEVSEFQYLAARTFAVHCCTRCVTPLEPAYLEELQCSSGPHRSDQCCPVDEFDVQHGWTRVRLDCLESTLIYQVAPCCKLKGPAVIWKFEDQSCGRAETSENYSMVAFRESTFILQLMNSEYKDVDAPMPNPGGNSSAHAPLIKRRHSAPDMGGLARMHSSVINDMVNSCASSRDMQPRPEVHLHLEGSQATRPLSSLRQAQVSTKTTPSESSRLANLVRSSLATTDSRSSNELVQTISGVIGSVATVVGSVATVALWMKKHNKRHKRRSDDVNIELGEMTNSGEIPTDPDEAGTPRARDPSSGSSNGIAPAPQAGPEGLVPEGDDNRSDEARSQSINAANRLESADSLGFCWNCGNLELSPRAYIERVPGYQQWVNTQFLDWIGAQDDHVCHASVEDLVDRKWKAFIEHDRETKILALSDRYDWRKHALEVEQERNELRAQIKKELVTFEELQQKRFKIVLHDLTTTVRAKQLDKKQSQLDQVIDAEVRSRTRPMIKRLEAEAKRQEHNRKIHEALQEDSLKTRKHLEERSGELQRAECALVTDQNALAQAQQEHATKDAELRLDIAKLKDILKAHDARAEMRERALQDELRKLVAREKELEKKEERANASMLQQRLELVRREHTLAEREKKIRKA